MSCLLVGRSPAFWRRTSWLLWCSPVSVHCFSLLLLNCHTLKMSPSLPHHFVAEASHIARNTWFFPGTLWVGRVPGHSRDTAPPSRRGNIIETEEPRRGSPEAGGVPCKALDIRMPSVTRVENRWFETKELRRSLQSGSRNRLNPETSGAPGCFQL